MELKINDKLHGFTVKRIRYISELEGSLVELSHDRTGAGLVWADNGEENKVFSVGFRTLPEDNTGVFHILEHSVLCGSDRYPVKEPFVELLKTSMTTFLNAMTYPDKTLYPVSSKMEQDYLNLMNVYLDAVFCPKILTDPNIFYQEGWHIDISGEAPVFKGVVYNEMKGAMSDVDQIAERTLDKLLFPDNGYGFNSGGDPEAITDLTYEEFVARYRRFYHPSNAYFYLDGAVPFDKTLSSIDSYLRNYDRLTEVPQLKLQTPVRNELTMNYEAGDDTARPVVAAGRIVGTWEDRSRLFALSILSEQLADSNESPLKRAVLSSGLAEDMELNVSDGIAQPYIMLLFRGVAPGVSAQQLLDLVSRTVDELLVSGLPADELHAAVNQMDFRYRQYPEPQGLYRAGSVFSSWLYGGDPALYLEMNDTIADIRRMIDEGELEKLAKEYLADTSDYSVLTLLPSVSLGEEHAAAEAEKVSRLMSTMSEEELKELNSRLAEWQELPDDEEALKTIPHLSLNDISAMPELTETEVSSRDGAVFLYHRIPTKGIIYLNAYFPLTGLNLEELPYAALLTEFLTELPTGEHTVRQLATEIKKNLGKLSFGIDIISRDDTVSECTPCLRARAAVLEDRLTEAEDIILEVLTRTRFDDRAMMKELIVQMDDESRRYAVASGHRLAMHATRSHYSSKDAASEALNGITFTGFIHGMNTCFDEKIDSFIEFADKMISENIVREGLVISITASDPADAGRLADMLPQGEARPAAASYSSPLPERLGIMIPSQVSYSASAYDLAELGLHSEGSLAVLSNILSYAYLWNEVRVKGGAYGTGVSSNRSGSLICYSYRDPSPVRSLDIYRSIPEFIERFSTDDADLEGFIISTIASVDPLISAAARGRAADDFWFSGHTDEARIRIRSEILSTEPKDLRRWTEAFRKLGEVGSFCIVGPSSALESCDAIETISI